MAIKITISDTVKVKVAGTIADASGPQPFDFTFTAKRLDADTLRERLAPDSDEKMADFLRSVILGWQGVKGDDGEVAFTPESLAQLLKIAGLAQLMFLQYVVDCGAKRKN